MRPSLPFERQIASCLEALEQSALLGLVQVPCQRPRARQPTPTKQPVRIMMLNSGRHLAHSPIGSSGWQGTTTSFARSARLISRAGRASCLLLDQNFGSTALQRALVMNGTCSSQHSDTKQPMQQSGKQVSRATTDDCCVRTTELRYSVAKDLFS